MKVFLASRFDEFKVLREEIISKVKILPSAFEINIINLNDSTSDVRSPSLRSIDEVSDSDLLLILIGDTYGETYNNLYSITHMEFLKAKNNIPILSFYIGENYSLESGVIFCENEKLKLLQQEALYHFGVSAFFNCKVFDVRAIADKIVDSLLYNYKYFAKSGYENFKKSFKHTPILEIISGQINSEPNTNEFYSGFKANWGIFAKNYDIEREIYSSTRGIKQYINNLTSDTNKFIIIQGSSGTGKSTLIRRIAFDYRDKYKIYFYNNNYNNQNTSLIELLNSSSFEENSIICIDNLMSILNKEGKSFDDINQPKGVIFIGTSHPSEFVKHISEFDGSEKLCEVFMLNTLSYNESLILIDKINELETNNEIEITNENITREKRISLINNAFGRHLLIAILVLRHGENIRNLVCNELKRITNDCAKRFYLLSCVGELLGERLDEETLFIKLKIDESDFIKIREIYQQLKGIIIEENSIIFVRHQVIARIVFDTFFIDLNEKERIIKTALQINDDFFTVKYSLLVLGDTSRITKRIKNLLSYNTEKILELFDKLKKSFLQVMQSNNKEELVQSILICKGLFLKSIMEFDESYICFEDAEKIKLNSYIIRQKAWIRLEQNYWDEAAEIALSAVAFEDNYKNNIECAEILSFSNVKSFYDAEKYFNNAVALASTIKETEYSLKKKEKYLEAKKILDLFSIIDDEIPEEVIKILNPKINLVVAQFESKSRFLQNRLMLYLAKNLSSFEVDQETVKEILDDIKENNFSRRLKAKYYSNLARYLYIQNYKGFMEVELKQIEDYFNKSIDFDNTDSFAYTWFGTFYKELKNDLQKAEELYRHAIKISENSKNEYYKRHPMLLNNLALLLTRRLELGENINIKEIHELYTEAITNSENTDFYWPKIGYYYFKIKYEN